MVKRADGQERLPNRVLFAGFGRRVNLPGRFVPGKVYDYMEGL